MAQQTFTGRKRVRKFFGHIKEVAEMPNLIEVQKASYDQFLMVEEPQGGRLDEGLQAVFRSVFPISFFEPSKRKTTRGAHYRTRPSQPFISRTAKSPKSDCLPTACAGSPAAPVTAPCFPAADPIWGG